MVWRCGGWLSLCVPICSVTCVRCRHPDTPPWLQEYAAAHPDFAAARAAAAPALQCLGSSEYRIDLLLDMLEEEETRCTMLLSGLMLGVDTEARLLRTTLARDVEAAEAPLLARARVLLQKQLATIHARGERIRMRDLKRATWRRHGSALGSRNT